jgi:hypothetical protein
VPVVRAVRLWPQVGQVSTPTGTSAPHWGQVGQAIGGPPAHGCRRRPHGAVGQPSARRGGPPARLACLRAAPARAVTGPDTPGAVRGSTLGALDHHMRRLHVDHDEPVVLRVRAECHGRAPSRLLSCPQRLLLVAFLAPGAVLGPPAHVLHRPLAVHGLTLAQAPQAPCQPAQAAERMHDEQG